MSKAKSKKAAKAAKKPAPAKKPAAKAKPEPKVHAALAAPAGPVTYVPWNTLAPSPLNPRKHFDADVLKEMAESILARGVMQNLTARPGPKGQNEIVIGETRWRAIGLLVKDGRAPKDFPVPVAMRDLTDADVLEIALIENTHRKNLTPLEEARGFAALRDRNVNTDDIAARTGIAKRTVQSRLHMLDKSAKETLAALEKGEISGTQARTLAKATHQKQRELLSAIAEGNDFTEEELLAHVMADYPPVDIAFFKRERYTGEIIEDDDGTKYFADEKQFLKLQNEAIAEKKAKWEADGVKVLVFRAEMAGKEPQFQSWNWERKPKHKDATTIIEVTRQMEVKVHTGMVEKRDDDDDDAGESAGAGQNAAQTDLEKAVDQAKADDTESGPAIKLFSSAHRIHANRRKTHVLQEAIASKPMIALRLTCARLLDEYAFNMLLVRKDSNPTPFAGPTTLAPAVREILRELTGFMPEETHNQFSDEQAEREAAATMRIEQRHDVAAEGDTDEVGRLIWAMLLRLEDEQVLRLFAALIARQTGLWGDELGLNSVEIEVADSLGLVGTEAKNGLGVIEDDIAGVRKEGLFGAIHKAGVSFEAMPMSSKAAAVTAGLIEQIHAGKTKDVVIPTLAFITTKDAHLALERFCGRSA